MSKKYTIKPLVFKNPRNTIVPPYVRSPLGTYYKLSKVDRGWVAQFSASGAHYDAIGSSKTRKGAAEAANDHYLAALVDMGILEEESGRLQEVPFVLRSGEGDPKVYLSKEPVPGVSGNMRFQITEFLLGHCVCYVKHGRGKWGVIGAGQYSSWGYAARACVMYAKRFGLPA